MLLDEALRRHLTSKEAVVAAVRRRPNGHGVQKALAAIAFADARADRSGESLSRVVIDESALAAPDLQYEFRRPGGSKAEVDFFWAEQGVVGEFDGETKYRDSERWSGLSPEQVVINEKNRENWLRSLPEVRAFVRRTWADVLSPGALARLLRSAGVPPKSGRSDARRAI